MLTDTWRRYTADRPARQAPRHTVLIVDDEASVCEFVDRVLREDGYATQVACSGSVALAKAEAHGRFDLLLTDVNMPHISGHALAEHIRRVDPEIKVLYFTGYSDMLFNAKGTLWEGEAFVEKPVSAVGLREAVALLLTGRTHA